jgi:hypothetical protein
MKARPLAGALAALAALSLSGCAVDAGSGRSAEEAGDDFRQVLDDTQQLVGGEWEVRDDPTPRGCSIPLWVEGDRYPALRIGTLPTTAAQLLTLVEEYWGGLGYAVESATVGEATELQAVGQHDETFIFRVSDNGMTLQGESECRPH